MSFITVTPFFRDAGCTVRLLTTRCLSELIQAATVRLHEVYLQNECRYSGAQPYWDEMEYAEGGPLNQSAVFDPTTGFGSGNSDDNGCITDGPFVNLTLHLNQTSNSDNACLKRALDQENFYQANSTYVSECMAHETYADAWNCWGRSPHLAGHFGVGGTVSSLFSLESRVYFPFTRWND